MYDKNSVNSEKGSKAFNDVHVEYSTLALHIVVVM